MEKKIIIMEEGWAFMEEGTAKLKRILEGLPEPSFSSEQYIMLYTTIYNMCTQKAPYDYSPQLYNNYRQVFVDYLKDTIMPALMQKHDEFMLKELVKRWMNHNIMMRWLSRFFYYLDRYHITRRSLPSLHQVGINCFRDEIYTRVHGNAKDAILALIEVEREGGQVDRALLKNALDIYIALGIEHYENDFAIPMICHTSDYYSRKAASWIQENTCPEYMSKAEESLKQEKDRVDHYLHTKTEDKLLEKVQHELLWVYENQLLEKENSGLRVLLNDDKVDDLTRMYRLYSKVPNGLEPIGKILKQLIIDEGTSLVQQADDAASSKAQNNNVAGGSYEQIFVRKVIELYDKFMAYVINCFGNHAIFHKAVKEAFETILSKGVAGNSSAELLAIFCDNVLKKGGSEKLSDDAIENSLEKVVRLLAYVSDKDLFGEFSRKKLSRRLLFDKSTNDDHERSILTKLKQQCGAQFTSKMEGMVTDMTLAKENQSQFEDYIQENPNVNPGLDMSVTVLTTGFWPSYKSSDLTLPAEMVKGIEVFKQFYATKTKHRKLTFIYSLGSCHLSAKFGAKTFELVLSTYQAAALLLFNTADRLSYSEIAEQLNLGDEDIVRVLHSLSCAKYKILIKEPSSRSVSKTDHFSFNSGFTDKMRRIRIPLPPVDERKKVVEDVDKDRRYAIDASVVRIMKSRKVLGYQQLITECVEQLSRMFKPDIKMIKKRIEDLITRDYIERDVKNPQMFRYLA
ncbi:hypothetical protein vseg_019086 [Gypsophila vaccaria]